jgi:hypothetical protein
LFNVIVKKHSSLVLPEHQWPEILWHVRIPFAWMFWHANQHLMMKKSFLNVIVKKNPSLFLPHHKWPKILWHVRISFAWMFWHANQHLLMKRSYLKKMSSQSNTLTYFYHSTSDQKFYDMWESHSLECSGTLINTFWWKSLF